MLKSTAQTSRQRPDRWRRAHRFASSFVVLTSILAGNALPDAASADPVEDFYRGKTITLSVGFSAGGGYDLHARILARYMGNYIPGNPRIIVKNVPGASGLVLISSLYNTLPKDGTEFATFDRAIPLEPLLDPQVARFDSLKMNWIGSTDSDASTCFAWHAASVKTFADLLQKQLIVGASGSIGDAVAFPKLSNAVLGTKFRVISGYPGSTESLLAIERGEIEGFCSMGFSTIETQKPGWLRDKKISVLMQFALEKNPDHTDVPLVLDLAKTTKDREALELIVSPQLFTRPFAAPPGVPPERVAALRKAFNDTMASSEYRAEAATRGMHVQLVKGEEIERVLRHLYTIPKDTVERVKAAIK